MEIVQTYFNLFRRQTDKASKCCATLTERLATIHDVMRVAAI